MDSADNLDDKDSGPEVQINIPSSVMSRIEELMGGTEQFDCEEFDAVAYINKIFPTEQSLSGVESAAARCEFRLQGVERDVRRLVREQGARRRQGQRALLDAQRCIAQLALQVADINKKAERSESMVREITGEIKQLDCAKSNLTAAITALNHLHMLAGGAAALQALAARRAYPLAAAPLQAVSEVLQHFSQYKDIPEVSQLRERVREIREQLSQQIQDDFKQAFTAGSKSAVSAREVCAGAAVLELLEPRLKDQLLAWLVRAQLQEYSHLFSAEQEGAWVAHVERRYAWLKRHLLAFEQGAGAACPPHWQLSQRIARAFCEMTRDELGKLMAARRDELDVKLLLYAIQKTHHFELLLHKRFVGTDLEVDSQISSPDKAGGLYGEGKDGGDAGGDGGGESPWVGAVGACFEPHLSLYIQSLDSNLQQLLDTFIQEARIPPAPAALPAPPAAGAVLSSCADLFLLYKKCLVQCARLTRGPPMLELASMFQKYLRLYCARVLLARAPRAPAPPLLGGGAGGAGGVPALVSTLHTYLHEPATHARYTAEETSRLTSIITTCEYCLETTLHLQDKLKEKVAPALRERIDLTAEVDLFHNTISDCIQMLVQDLELSCEPALLSMTKIAWLHCDSVGDQSPYVTQIVTHLRGAVPVLRDCLASSRKYFTQLCIRFANSFVPKFIQNVYKCKPVSTAGAEQLLLDTHMLKTALLELPSAGSAVKRPAPAPYTKVVIRLMTKAEMILKLVMAPLGGEPRGFCAQFVALLPEASLAEFHRVLDMKGARLTKAQMAALDASFKELNK